ncbi:MAG TPA: FAD-binding oxidoreductase [Chloroflexota bacterium]|nr:FAD-binding oxidoreductase [Chloroflexota bacterium]
MTLTDFRPAALGLATRNLLGRALGEVIRPADKTYDDARQVWNTAFDRYPALIVRAADAADVLRGVEFAREQDLPLAVRSGGHSFAGFGTVDGGVVLDLSRMKGVSIDPRRGTAWVQPGATTADVAPKASRYGLSLPTGDVKSVGIGGLTRGGGIGFLVRKHGMTIDHLMSIEMVTADGRLVTASADENPDLFWAVRGGGGNFGVVTAFEFRLAPVNMIYGGAMILPATSEVLAGYLDYSLRAPEELTTISMLTTLPPAPIFPPQLHGKTVLLSFVCYDGDAQSAARALQPLREVAAPLAEKLGPMPYAALFEMTAGGAQPGASIARSGFFNGINQAGIDTMIEAAHAAPPAGHSMIQLRPLGGQMARVAPTATAFAHRSASYMVAVTGGWEAREDALSTRTRVISTWEALAPQAQGVYVNFLGDEGTSRIREAYPGSTYERLVAIKRRYDPANLFSVNQNIHPGR